MDQATSFHTKLKWAVAILVIPVLALIGYVGLHVLFGLAVIYALGISFGIGALAYALLPAITLRLTQLKYSAYQAVAAAFPDDTLDVAVARGAKHLKRAWEALAAKGTIVEEFRMNVAEVERDHPEDVEDANMQLKEAQEQMAFAMADWLEQEQLHLAFVKEVARQKRRWRLAQQGKKLRTALAMKDDFMNQMATDAALNAIKSAHAESIAHMKLSSDVAYMRKRMAEAKQAPPPLTFDTSGKVVLPVLNVQAIEVEGKPA